MNSLAIRTVVMDTDRCMINRDGIYSSPVAPCGGFATLLDRIHARAAGNELVLILDEEEFGYLWDTGEPVGTGLHPVLAHANSLGWKCTREVRPWMTFYRKLDAVHVLVPHLIKDAEDQLPFPGTSPTELGRALDIWHCATGAPYHHRPGVAGLSLLKHVYAHRQRQRGAIRPDWKLTPDPVLDWYGCELQWQGERDWWRDPGLTGKYWLHTYDVRGDYLAAAQVAPISLATLRHAGGRPFDPKLAGMWRVKFGKTLLPHLPDPAGYGATLADGSRWVATPTLQLVEQATADGWHEGFDVLDAWTGKGSAGLRPWTEVLKKHREDPVIGGAIKKVYTHAIGMMAHQGVTVARPDWAASVIAVSRANLWRKLYAAGLADGVWPTRVHFDQPDYASYDSDPTKALPPSIDLGDLRIGKIQYKPGNSREIERPA